MRPTILILFGSLFLSSLAHGQPVSIGVKGGVPLNDAFNVAQGNGSSFVTNTKRYIVGPTIEFHLPARFSIEIDALYSRLNYGNTLVTTAGGTTVASTRANSWQFPVLAKFEILPGPVRPFIDAGATIRNISGLSRSVASATGISNSSTAPEFNKSTDVGFTAGVGIAFKAGWVRISPEFRFTRWGGENFRDPVNSLLTTNRNNGVFLLGFTF